MVTVRKDHERISAATRAVGTLGGSIQILKPNILVLLVFLGLSQFSLSGCGLRQLAFNNADWLAMYRLDSYFDLTSEQKRRFTPDLEAYIRQQKNERLPEVVAMLQDAKQTKSLTYEKTTSGWLAYSRLRVAALSDLLPFAVPFLASLKEEQWQHLEEELTEGNENWQKLANPESDKDFERARDKRFRKQMSRFEEFLGSLSADQEELVKPLVYQDAQAYQAYFAARQAAQQTFVSELRRAKTEAEIKALLTTWITLPEKMYGEVHYKHISDRREKWQRILVDLHATLSESQRHELNKNLDDWIEFLTKQVK